MQNAISMLVIWGSQVVIMLANIATQAILARNFTPSDYGQFVSTLTLISIFATLAAFGVSQYWLKIFGREGIAAFRWMKHSRNLIIITTIISVLSCCFFVLLINNETLTTYTFILIPIIIHTALYSLLTAIFQLSRQYIKMSLFQTFFPLSKLVVALVVIYLFAGNLSSVAIGYSIFAIVLIIVSISFYRKFVKRKIDLAEYKNIEFDISNQEVNFSSFLKELAPYGFLGFVYLIYYQIDVFMINLLNSPENAAFYSVAISLLSAIYIFPTAIYQRFFGPQIHKWVYHDKRKVIQFHRIGNKAMLLLSALVIIGIGLLGEVLIVSIFGKAYSLSYEILILLTLSVPFRLLGNNMGTIMNTGNFVNSKLFIQGTAAVFNVLSNFILLNTIGLTGAIITTIITEFFIWVSFARVYSKKEEAPKSKQSKDFKNGLFLISSYGIFLMPSILAKLLFLFLWLLLFNLLIKSLVKQFKSINEKTEELGV